MNRYSEQFEVFYDGACSLCKAEMNLLRRLDRKSRIVMTDIADDTFDAQTETGRSYDVLMRSIHGRFADGRIVNGVEVFRQLYGRIGLGPFVALSRLPGLNWLCDLFYALFARYRLPLTGRCPDEGACRIKSVPRDETSEAA